MLEQPGAGVRGPGCSGLLRVVSAWGRLGAAQLLSPSGRIGPCSPSPELRDRDHTAGG